MAILFQHFFSDKRLSFLGMNFQIDQLPGAFLPGVKRLTGVVALQAFERGSSKPLVIASIQFTLYHVHIEVHKRKKPHICVRLFSGPDGTRTRDLRRDRAAF